jgi:hypothetical protein
VTAPKPALALLAAASLALAGCEMALCGNRVLNVARSPDGRHAAVIFRRDCGATTGFSTQVSLAPNEATPDDSGNLLILGDEPGLSAQWLGPDRLLISYRRGARLFRQESVRDGVRIEYRVR